MDRFGCLVVWLSGVGIGGLVVYLLMKVDQLTTQRNRRYCPDRRVIDVPIEFEDRRCAERRKL